VCALRGPAGRRSTRSVRPLKGDRICSHNARSGAVLGVQAWCKRSFVVM
jgi:hypothetical protein